MSSSLAKLIAGKVVYGVICLSAAVLLVVAGYAHKVVGQVADTGKGIAIKGSPSVGAMNILVMGLESRTNYQGQELDHHLQVVLHSGSNGSQDTNTLILIHIFAGGKKAVGFSIPRDSLVQFPHPYLGYSEGKIDAPYAWAYNQYLDQHPSEPSAARFLHANQAGQAAAIATVESVTGVKVDHFMEVNLIGFYYLAQAFGGIEACVMPAPAAKEPAGMPAGTNLTDHDPLTGTDNSGFDAYQDGYNKSKGGAQYLHLNAAQSLAFVRSRDTLPGIDLGRTQRQQAAIDYVIYQLKHEGVFSDLTKLNSLLGTADQYLITDSGFNLLDFATEMQALTGQHLSLTTLGGTTQNNVTVPGYPAPQDVLQVNVPQIQQIVHKAFYPQAAASGNQPSAGKSATANASPAQPASGVTVDVYNGGATPMLAGEISRDLVALGYKAGTVGNSSAQSQPVTAGTQVFYGAGASGNAGSIAREFGTTATALGSLPADRVEVLIGSTVTQAPAALASPGSAGASTQSVGSQVIGARPAASTPATATPTSGTSGTAGTVTVAPNAPFGIPCVY